MNEQPRLIDNDRGSILVTLKGRQLRGWSYQNDNERKVKMLAAREYVEGWCDGLEVGKTHLFLRSLHVRAELQKALASVDGLSKNELLDIVDRLVPKSIPIAISIAPPL